METNNYQSDLAIHPGEFLEEILEDLGMSQKELSNRIGRPTQTINEIIKGKKSITSKTAIELEDVLKVPAHIWMGLENEYQMIQAKNQEIEQIKEETSLLSKFPYLDLAKIGLVKSTRNAMEKVEELRAFFSVAKLGQLEYVKVYQPAFRVSDHKIVSHEAIASWLQAGRVIANEVQTEIFDKKMLENSLDELKALMNVKDVNDAITGIKEIFSRCGVAFIMLPHFKGTKVNGATFWLNKKEKAVLMMTIRGGCSDIFWFSLFHELGHILLHTQREVFLEDGYSDPALQKQEDEADSFARDFLINRDDYNEFIEEANFTKKAVLTFAKEQEVKPSIVVGRLMHEKFVKYNDHKLSPLRDKYKWSSNE